MNAKILSGDLESEAAGDSSNWDHNVTESKGSQFRPGPPERGLRVSVNRCWISVEKQSPKYLRNAELQGTWKDEADRNHGGSRDR